MKRVLFIGLGHMGGSLVSGIAKKAIPGVELYGFNKDVEQAENLAKKIGNFKILKNLQDLEKAAIDVIVIGVRPIDFNELAEELNQYNLANKTIISMVNALTLDKMDSAFAKQKDLSLIRMMPNMNASIQESVTALTSKNASEAQMNFAKELFQACGFVTEIPESKFATFAAIAGCLPSYVFTFYQAIVQYAEEHGFNHHEAMEIVGAAITGSVHNAEQNTNSLATMIKQICVPNGSTIEGQKVLEANDFDGIIKKALKAANDKA
ncbi:pyrroline-5-carboxylate reductase [Entomoplasma freundtii]|uniref:Pyrroline-5-carboxylate reductase n=2 Tax=Entomoplasma freundtii TaxID=74700 RepID=A0A2K8NSC9_9MOLU|nr:pyrroline-5-carboxylate reductase dimerization domain-containing protein [Entomoplasma freundtii]ATZ16709.1 pyrroline-5-carboxylate reductase [Entomoplasma freundtii]TDY58124.1 pyrroline-5-carboxylate reductase [Entomoplasma freundtii]